MMSLEVVVHRMSEFLLAAEKPLSCLVKFLHRPNGITLSRHDAPFNGGAERLRGRCEIAFVGFRNFPGRCFGQNTCVK